MSEKTAAQKTGGLGESAAAAYLQKKGFSVLKRNYHSRCGEIDIIAADHQYIVFAEVKTRNTDALDRPAAWVDSRKQNRIIKTAIFYLQQFATDLQPRFDVIEVIYEKKTRMIVSIEHIENAFTGGGY